MGEIMMKLNLMRTDNHWKGNKDGHEQLLQRNNLKNLKNVLNEHIILIFILGKS